MFIRGLIDGAGFQHGFSNGEDNNLLDNLITEILVLPVSIWI